MEQKDELVLQQGEYSGWKIKVNGQTTGQLPRLDMAIKRMKTLYGNDVKITFKNNKGEIIENIEGLK